MKIRLSVTAICLAMATSLLAQERSEIYVKANNAYEMGHFAAVDTILRNKVESLSKDDQIQSYRILALSCIYRDMTEQAEEYALKLLALDPFYTAYGDSPRFADILTRLKKGGSTISTASKMAESVEEVPVPVTLITQEMIRASGATKLQDVLKLYVPGMSEIKNLEDNMAMRGVYGLSQETILVMIDGHRLNSQATNGEPFDFRNSLDKIKQIEVLRGPASSLYGNVSLTAVVNIITKNGSDVGGGRVQFIGGKNSTYGGGFLVGNGNLKFDYMVWGSIYSSKGEQVNLDGTAHYLEGYKDKPTFDVGAKIRWGDLKVEATAQHGHPVPYYNLLSINDKFTYDNYGTVNGEGPGMSQTNMRFDVEWGHTWKNFTLSASGFMSTERQQIYNALGDTIDYYIAAYLAKALNIPIVKTKGVRQVISWEDYTFGGSLSGNWNYKFRGGMNGSLLFGLQFEEMLVGDAILMLGADYNQSNNVMHNILVDGSESTLSGFIQLKHYFTKKLIFNGGLRSDRKRRVDGRTINTISPRISLIWLPSQVLTVKGAYSHAFVDAPTFYRGSTISLFSGGSNLDPEKMDSYQISANFNWKRIGFKYEINTFYNNVQDLVYYNMGGTSESQTFVNAGHIEMLGAENTLQYEHDRFVANLNCTYQYPLKVENFYSVDEHTISNVPRLLFNATLQYAIVSSQKGDRLWIRASTHAQSGFNVLENDLMQTITQPGTIITHWQPSYATVNAGIEWKSRFGLGLGFDLYNLGNVDYEVGGQLKSGVPGLSRSYIFRASFDIKSK